MGENLAIGGREAVRSPMQWTADDNGGFSKARKSRLTAPVVDDGYSPRFVNVTDQRHDPDSLLSFIRNLIRIYRNSSEIGWGAFEVIDQPHSAVLAHSVTAPEGRMVALHNFGPDPVSVGLTIPDTDASTRVVDLLEGGEVVLSDSGAAEFELGGYGYRWLRVIEPGSRRLY